MLEVIQNYLPLLQKYDQRGPRYTSYPAAPHFQPGFAEKDLGSIFKALAGKDLSLYFHIPYCKSLCWYCGCHMQVNKKPQAMQTYLGHMKQEIRQIRSRLDAPGLVKQIHFGGGSPNLLTPDQLADFMAFIRHQFEMAKHVEISIEADPRLIDEPFVLALQEQGFNRISLGIQDFNAKVQQAINRIQPYRLVVEKLALLNAAGLTAINMDVMYGLPYQNRDTFEKTLHQVVSLEPQRIALFNFAHLPDFKPHMKLIDAATIPDAITKFQLFWQAKQVFEENGYQYIGMDHFSKKGDPLFLASKKGDLHRNFQGYTTHAGLQMLGFGASSISFLNNCFMQNHAQIKDYGYRIDQGQSPISRGILLSKEDRFRAGIIQRLFCQKTIDLKAIETHGGKPFDELFPTARLKLRTMVDDWLLVCSPEGWRVTALGQVLLRNIAMIFDSYLGNSQGGKRPNYSKTL